MVKNNWNTAFGVAKTGDFNYAKIVAKTGRAK